MEYREGEKSVFVDSEVLATGKGIAIFANSIRKWHCPSGEQPVSTEEKSRIIANIKAAIDFQKQPLEIL